MYTTPKQIYSIDELRQEIRKTIKCCEGEECVCGLGIDINELGWMKENDMDMLEIEFNIQFKGIGNELLICPSEGVFMKESEVRLVNEWVYEEELKTIDTPAALRKHILDTICIYEGQRVAILLGIHCDILDNMTDNEISAMESDFDVVFRRSTSSQLAICPRQLNGVFECVL